MRAGLDTQRRRHFLDFVQQVPNHLVAGSGDTHTLSLLDEGANHSSAGEGLGNQFLAHIRSTDAIVQVVRAFHDDNVIHVDNTHDPKKDIDVINTELVLADLQTVERRLPKLEKEAKANPKLQPAVAELQAAKATLDAGTPLFADTKWQQPSEWLRKELQLLTLKPILYVFNVDEQTLTDTVKQAELRRVVAPNQAIFICAKLESELEGLDENDATELLESYGVKESGLVQLIHAAYHTLGLQSYLTAGPKEVRAWTIKQGATAPEAAGVIHTDFERGFIAAQVIDYNDLIAAGSEMAAKAAGKVATVGKDYIMQPNDIVEFRFNVSK